VPAQMKIILNSLLQIAIAKKFKINQKLMKNLQYLMISLNFKQSKHSIKVTEILGKSSVKFKFNPQQFDNNLSKECIFQLFQNFNQRGNILGQ